MTILRSFAINLYQIYFNKNKDTKIDDMFPTTMANIKHICGHSDKFVSDIFELKQYNFSKIQLEFIVNLYLLMIKPALKVDKSVKINSYS